MTATELRLNNEIGFLGVNLTPTTTGSVANFFQTKPTNFPTLPGAGNNFVKLALDAGQGNFEIIYVTAYNPAAGSPPGTTATIARAQEDAGNWPAAAHTAFQSTWQVVPTVADFTGFNTAIAAETTRATNAENANAAAILLRLLASNNLSDVVNKVTALINLIGGSPTNGQLLQYNGTAWVPITIAALPPNGPATGDLSGTYPAPTVAGLRGTGIANTPPTTGQVLQFTGTQWVPTTLIPTGTLLSWTGSAASIPTGWVAANGQPISRTGASAALFALYGTTFGAGDGSTTFNLPDLRGRVQIGYIDNSVFGYANRTSGQTMGSANILTSNLPNLGHSHNINLTPSFQFGATAIAVQVPSGSQGLQAGSTSYTSYTTNGVYFAGPTDTQLSGFTNVSFSQPAFAIVPIIKL